ncbi:unnamed protein product [Musa acuminata subsp. burmannicoides]
MQSSDYRLPSDGDIAPYMDLLSSLSSFRKELASFPPAQLNLKMDVMLSTPTITAKCSSFNSPATPRKNWDRRKLIELGIVSSVSGSGSRAATNAKEYELRLLKGTI